MEWAKYRNKQAQWLLQRPGVTLRNYNLHADFKPLLKSKSLSDARSTLEMENYRYLQHPGELNRTYDVLKTQRLRNQVLQETCDQLEHHLPVWPPPRHLVVDDQNKFLFCEVRKVSSITWRRVLDSVALANSTGNVTGGLRRLGTYSDREKESRLRHYTKFMFVREPMLRLFSGWRDKFVAGPQRRDYEAVWGPKIRRFSNLSTINNSSVSQGQVRQTQNISFLEFVRYLTGSVPSLLLRDMHWEPYLSRCRPCRIRYDFVGHYETLSHDAAAILRVIAHQLGRPVTFPIGRSNTPSLARWEFTKLADKDISRLARLYELDYKLFGYSMDRFVDWLQSQ